ncbi:MAG: thioredoxin [Novosphingobium sp.]|nr:thioredoxin [Novosphingobium sp.]MBO9603885.1 thioredoxin [Novosphingobium sp.]
MATKAVTDASFEADVLKADKPVVVDFWADWCTPCKAIAPALEEIAEELAGEVSIMKMDIMENPDVPGQLGVRNIPFLVMFKDGKPVAHQVGAAPKSALKGWIQGAL